VGLNEWALSPPGRNPDNLKVKSPALLLFELFPPPCYSFRRMKRLLFLLISCASLLFTGCSMFTMKGPFPAYDPEAVIPEDFLYTKYEPLNRWLDTPIRVQILDTPLLDVFRHPALVGLSYEMKQMPAKNPRITIDRIAMTRRQLLWSLAQDHQLRMTAVFGDTGESSRIVILRK
jgi:hypothetical protein